MNEQAETKLSTMMPRVERVRRARRSAPADIAALRLNHADTAGEKRCADGAARLAATGGGATAVRRSASREMARTPAVLSTGADAVAKVSVMTPLCPIFRQHSQPTAFRGVFPSP